jgi:probable rRNA maturation factor
VTAGRDRRLLVTVSDARGRRTPDFGLARWLEDAAPRAARGEVAIALVRDAEMRALNRAFRGKDKVTDVLSFPANAAGKGRRAAGGGRESKAREPQSAACSPQPATPRLGDLAIAQGVAARQAREFGHPVKIELRILALHGLLHLLGYDHETDSGTMRRLEDRLRRRARLPTGLVARAQAPHLTSESGR